jgi:hypothetical protein
MPAVVVGSHACVGNLTGLPKEGLRSVGRGYSDCEDQHGPSLGTRFGRARKTPSSGRAVRGVIPE